MTEEQQKSFLDSVQEKAEAAKKSAELAESSKTEAEKAVLIISNFTNSLAKLNPVKEVSVEQPTPLTKGKPIHDYLVDYDYYTAKASDINRSLALAGVAIVWLFRNPEGSKTLFPDPLLYPLWFLIISLGLDLLQYFLGAIFWGIFYEYKFHLWKRVKNKLTDEQVKDIEAPNLLSIPLVVIFFAKISAMVYAYYELFVFLQNKIAASK